MPSIRTAADPSRPSPTGSRSSPSFVIASAPGLYILDEPEAALSPSRQLSLLRILHDLEATGQTQFLIATHAPILMAYPGAASLGLDEGRITPVEFRETEHYRLTQDFLSNPDRYLSHLFAEPREPEPEP